MIPFSLLAGALVLLAGAADAALSGEALYLRRCNRVSCMPPRAL
jgi:hypothetical protein